MQILLSAYDTVSNLSYKNILDKSVSTTTLQILKSMARYIRFLLLPRTGEHWYSMDLALTELGCMHEGQCSTPDCAGCWVSVLCDSVTAIDMYNQKLLLANTKDYVVSYYHVEKQLRQCEHFRLFLEQVHKFKDSMAGGLFTVGTQRPHPFDEIVKAIPIYLEL